MCNKNIVFEWENNVLINNAGVGITGPLEELNSDKIVENFVTNCFGPLNLIQAVLPHMRKQNRVL